MGTRRCIRYSRLSPILLLLGMLAPPAWAQTQAPAGELSLSEAIKNALGNHPSLRAAAHGVAAATAGIELARAGFLPRVDVSEGFTESNNPVYVFGALLNQGRFTQADFAVDKLNSPDAISNWRTNIYGSLPLFLGGRNYLGYQQAQLGRDASEQARARAEQQVIFGVIRAYDTVVLAEEAQSTVEASVRTAEANLASAEARYDAGMVVASDALAARVRLARLKEEAIAAASHVQLAHATLNEAMGLPQTQAYRVTGLLLVPPVLYEKVDGLDSLAREHRPDYQQAVLEEARQEKEVVKAKGAFLPTLHLLGNYELNNHYFASQGQDSWTVGVVLNLNLFKGGEDHARLLEAEANHRRATALREQLASAIGLQVREAFLALKTARLRLTVAQGAVAQAEESLRIIQNRYDAGLTTIVELLDSETALTAARTNLTRARYEAAVGQARLDLSLGTLDAARF
jgi:outer membrane protein